MHHLTNHDLSNEHGKGNVIKWFFSKAKMCPVSQKVEISEQNQHHGIHQIPFSSISITEIGLFCNGVYSSADMHYQQCASAEE